MRIPTATYRFQFHKGFTFQQARTLLPYLCDLGISDVYASPIFTAGPESTHGYDICAFDELNPNLGSAADFEELTGEIRKLGMGLVVDMVPNHMGSHSSNQWWIDVLTKGQKSEFATYFDINWNPANRLLKGKVLLPVLGDHYGAVLERGELKVTFIDGEFRLAYFDKTFPLSPESISEFRLRNVPDDERDQFLARLNGNPKEPTSFDQLHHLIDLQHYRLAYWRTGPHEINYRRFFDVTELVSVRVEDESVFKATHEFLFELLQAGKITGLRIDHPDGLRDPKTYFFSLHSRGKNYILAEKILSDDERLPSDWPIHGTTGYDYLICQNGLFVASENERAFTEIYSRFTNSAEDFPSIAFRSKKEVLNRMFIAEVNSLTAALKFLAESTRSGRDFTELELRHSIVDFIAGFPIYRTYVTERTDHLSPCEVEFLQAGLAEAKKRSVAADHSALEFLARLLALNFPHDFTAELKARAREFIIRFQQLSGPATAKGLEDTAFYRYTRFVSLNEVGGNPGRFGTSVAEFHTYNFHKQQYWPHSMLATSTHDTKRGEDTRARLNVLSEMPAEWEQQVRTWYDLNRSSRKGLAPSPIDEYLLYQVLVGTWVDASDLPTYIDRIQKYMLKAVREAKVHTSWTEQNESYENSLTEFIAAILTSREFQESLSRFSQDVAYFGMFNSIAQVVLKTTAPGVPDFYQGSENWDLTLVDPDNRRPIDYRLRQQILDRVSTVPPAGLLKDWQTGSVKTFAVAKALRIRRETLALTEGAYHPIEAVGEKSTHIIAFTRTTGNSSVLVAVPRFVRTLTKGQKYLPSPQDWVDTRLNYSSSDRFENLLTGEAISGLTAANLFATFPAAILKPV